MGQYTLFVLFMITLLVGAFVYFLPKKHQAINPLSSMTYTSSEEEPGETVIKKTQQMNVITNQGALQVNRQLDDLTREQKNLEGLIKDEQEVLDNTNKEISDISKQVNGKSDIDVLKLKALGKELQDEKRLLVEYGRQLLDLNGQIAQKRKLLAEEREQVNINTDSMARSDQAHNTSNKDQTAALMDNVKQKNEDAMQHAKDLIEQERQKALDRKNR